MVISKTLAEKYFGKNAQAVGKTMKTVYDLYTVTGVIEDVPKNSHIRYRHADFDVDFLKNNQNGGEDSGVVFIYTHMFC